MFVRKEITESDRLRKKVRQIPGRITKDKFKSVMEEVLKKVDRIEAFERYFDPTIAHDFKRLKADYHDLLQTTSNEKILESMILCEEDLDQLLDDMTHGVGAGTYDKRLKNALAFLKDFQSQPYQRDIKFYEESSSKFYEQLESIYKDVQYKLSKMTYQVRQITEEIDAFEKENIRLVSELESINKESYQYKDIAYKIQDFHQNIEMNQSTIQMLRKTMNAFRLLGSLFNQLTLLDEYFKHLKEDGYVRKLVQRLYRKPEELDVLDNTADLTQAIQSIKEEIINVESIVKPAKRMIFEDLEEPADESIIEKYKAMAK
jgi:hypothetical protein